MDRSIASPLLQGLAWAPVDALSGARGGTLVRQPSAQ